MELAFRVFLSYIKAVGNYFRDVIFVGKDFITVTIGERKLQNIISCIAV